MFLWIIITVFALGAFWVYITPFIQAQIPASVTTNKWMQIAVTGALILLAVFIVSRVVKTVDGKAMA
jgi:hypothetical protein